MKRYDYDRTCEQVVETPAGDLVKYKDAADLQRQLAEAQHELANTKACLHARNTGLAGAEAKLAEVTRDRDALRAMLVLADERINRLVAQFEPKRRRP